MSHNAPKTRLRVLRRDIRRELGVSSDPAPSVDQLLEALAYLGAALDVASQGEYGAAVYRFKDGSHAPARSVLAHRRNVAAAWREWSEGRIGHGEFRAREAASERQLDERSEPSAFPRHWQV